MTPRQRPSLQRGSTLIIAIVLLLLLSLIGIFAVNVGLSEQRVSGSELRSRIVRQVAEAALSETFEYLRMSGDVPTEPQGEVDLTLWQPCGATDTTFPCGVVPQTVQRDTDGDGTAETVPFRAATYRYIGDGGFDMDGDGSIDDIERYMISTPPIPGEGSTRGLTEVGNFPVRYGVGAVLCSLDASRACVGAGGTDESRSGLATVTLVAIAEIPGENARATLVQGYGSFNIFSVPPSAPPLVSGGIMQGVGSATLVANPDSGGVGVPVSVWNRGPMKPDTGSWQTCQLDEFVRSGGAAYVSPSGVIVCTDCNCLTAEIESKGNGGGGGPRLRPDIQTPRGGDNDDDAFWAGPDGTIGTSDDTIPSQFFPCDLFEYVFGRRARLDDDDGDGLHDADTNGDGIADPEAGLPYGVCESGIDESGAADGGPDGELDAVVDYMDSVEATQIADCGVLDELTAAPEWEGGIFWVQGGCQLSNQVGTPEFPVVIVSQEGFSMQGNAVVFGVLFAIDHTDVDIDPSDLGSISPSFSPGGGRSQVYGSVVVEGGGMINGTIDLIASPKVLDNVNRLPNARRFGTVPGSWSDRFSY